MKRQDTSKQVKKVKLLKVLEGQTFYLTQEKEPNNLKDVSAAEFDAWAMQFVEGIDNVNREVWDVFARWNFVNWLIEEGLVTVEEPEEQVLLIPAEPGAEEKTSDVETEPEEKSSDILESQAS